MRKLILTLPIVALALAAALLVGSADGVFAAPNSLPTPEVTASDKAALEESTADWVETKKKPKPKKSAHKP